MADVSDLTPGASLEMTGRDIAGLLDSAPLLPAGTRVNVTYLAHEDQPLRVAAATAVRTAGLTPVPHLAARRFPDEAALTGFLDALAAADCAEHVFVIAGDPATPLGPFADALAVIRSGLLPAHGVSSAGIGGYPEGHPDIDDDSLWAALIGKTRALREAGLDGEVITQFGFDAEAVLGWAERVRDAGVELPIRVGVPGPAGVKRLLSFAGRLGVSSGASIARKYGFSLTNLLGTAGPERFLAELAEGYDPQRHGELGLHLYTFGGLRATAEWLDGGRAARA